MVSVIGILVSIVLITIPWPSLCPILHSRHAQGITAGASDTQNRRYLGPEGTVS